jgi:hypothetical protein
MILKLKPISISGSDFPCSLGNSKDRASVANFLQLHSSKTGVCTLAHTGTGLDQFQTPSVNFIYSFGVRAEQLLQRYSLMLFMATPNG